MGESFCETCQQLGQSPSLPNAYLAIIAGTQFVFHRLHQSSKLSHLVQEDLNLTRLLPVPLLQIVDLQSQLVVCILAFDLPFPELLESLLVEVQPLTDLIVCGIDVDKSSLDFLLEDCIFSL